MRHASICELYDRCIMKRNLTRGTDDLYWLYHNASLYDVLCQAEIRVQVTVTTLTMTAMIAVTGAWNKLPL